MRVALVHEFLTQLGGAERVLECFHEIFPEAPVYTLVYDEARTRGVFANWDVRTSWLRKMPGMPRHYKWYLPLMARAIRSFDFSEFNLVLSDSSAFAKGIKINKSTWHVCYCHTPTRYLWQELDEYVASAKIPRLFKIPLKHYLKYHLKNWDYKAAQKPDFFIANSRTVQKRIKRYYNRDSTVIYPPVNTDFFKPVAGKENFYFTASRLEPYKKIRLVVEAFRKLDLPLKVAGEGTGFFSLKQRAGNNIEFLGRVTDSELRELYSKARAFVFPALEDAGIMVLESLACGTPVIGLGLGGTAEFITDDVNGVLFDEQTSQKISEAVKRFQTLNFEPGRLRNSVLQYGKENFKNQIRKVCALV